MSDEPIKSAAEFRQEALNEIEAARKSLEQARREVEREMPASAMVNLWVAGISVETARQCMRVVSAAKTRSLIEMGIRDEAMRSMEEVGQ